MDTLLATAIVLVGVAILTIGCLALMNRIWRSGSEEEAQEVRANQRDPLT